jgi:methanogenic corrinoid protein MtbC1/DNA-binding transcriptional regulator YiaG
VTALADRGRLRALQNTGLLDSPPEEAFDRLTRLATSMLGAPVSLVSLVEPERQFFKSCLGLDEPWASQRESPLSHSFCKHAVLSGEPLVIPDARKHPLVQNNPAIRDMGTVAYLGIPLVTGDGYALGSFCVIDTQPREWTTEEVSLLRDLAASVMSEIELRTSRRADAAALPLPRTGDRPHRTVRPLGGLNIAAIARRTGVPADTLRKWEQRYGVLRPERTQGGQRRYSELDVARVEWLRERIGDGYRIGEAAELLGDRDGTTARTPAELRRALLAAVQAADVEEIPRLLDQAFALLPTDQALTRVLEPVLERVGEAWESGELSIAQEHLLSQAVRARLERMLADPRGGVRGVAVLACVPGERHELGLLMLGLLLGADGWQVVYLGADTPVEDAVTLAGRVAPSVLCLSVTLPEHLRGLGRIERPPDVTLVLGGKAATATAARRLRAKPLTENLRRSVRELRKLAA